MTVDDSPTVVGVDFGTLSARAVVARASDGAELGTGISEYRNGAIERTLPYSGQPLPADWALQDPADWRAALAVAVREALNDAVEYPASVAGIGTDFAASPAPSCGNTTLRRDSRTGSRRSRLLEDDEDTYRRTERWIEAADSIVWRSTGRLTTTSAPAPTTSCTASASAGTAQEQGTNEVTGP